MKRRVYTSLYLSEILYPILFCVAVITVQLMFYFRLLYRTEVVQKSTPLELLPAFVMFCLMLFFVFYMLFRIVVLDDDGICYKYFKKKYFIAWDDVKYVKISLNNNDKVGFGSYLVIATSPYPLQHTDFRASQDGFIVFKYRRSALSVIEKHYSGEIIKAAK